MKLKISLVLISLSAAFSAFETSKHSSPIQQQQQQQQGFVIDTIARDLVVPWQIVFLPDGTMLFTEREGRLRIYRDGKLAPKPAIVFQNVPLNNKSGLLGMCVHPDFPKNNFIYLAHNYAQGNAMKLRVMRYQFKNDSLTDPKTIFENIPANRNHTGCRLIFGPDKKLYVSTGDADQPAMSQDLKAYNGKILRVNDDGTVPPDNPFVKTDSARKEIWSYGHRNPQGLAFQPGTNDLYSSEHGPTGGDEINRIRKGMNYGWPVIHHQESKEGMVSPLVQYTPSVGPSEAMFYRGEKFPDLTGKLLVACLRGESILVLSPEKDSITSQQIFLKKQYGRIRSLVTGPDGNIYFSTSQIDPAEGKGGPPFDMILRMRPVGGNLRLESVTTTTPQIAVRKPTTENLIQQLCGSCHGNDLNGTARAKGLIGNNLTYGRDGGAIIKNISNGIPEKGMPAWKGAISDDDIDKIAQFIVSRRIVVGK